MVCEVLRNARLVLQVTHILLKLAFFQQKLKNLLYLTNIDDCEMLLK